MPCIISYLFEYKNINYEFKMTIFEKHLKLVYKLKMNPLKAVLIDLSGTIHIDKGVIPGSIAKEPKTSLVYLLIK